MNTADSRIDYIAARLTNYFVNEVNLPVLQVAVQEWSYDIDDFGPTAACGWAWPVESDEGLIIVISPEVIARTTEHLESPHLDDYLGIIEFVLARHITLKIGMPDLSPWDRHKGILDNIQDDHPQAMGLLQEIQLQANRTIGG